MLQAIGRRWNSTEALSSALAIVGPKAVSIARVIIPDIDPDSLFKHGISGIRENLSARKINENDLLGRSLDVMLKDYQCWRQTQSFMSNITLEREDILAKLKSEDPETSEFKDLRTMLADVKTRYKTKQKELWKEEEIFLVPYFSLPNELDPSTPQGEEDVELHVSSVAKPGLVTPSISSHADCPDVQFDQNAKLVFLKNSLAIQEIELCQAAQEAFLEDGFCDIIASPDIVKSVVLEGCFPGSFGNPDVAFALEKCSDFKSLTSGLGAHLVGSASFPGMVTFFVKNVLSSQTALPLNYITVGRQYRPLTLEKEKTRSLFSTEQSTCVGLLSLNENSESLQKSFESILEKLKSFFDSLNVHYRLVVKKAQDLSLAESHRVEAQMWSPLSQNYKCVGSISKYGDFVSRRLLVKYSFDGLKTSNYLHMIGGTVIDTHKVIGCLLENKAKVA